MKTFSTLALLIAWIIFLITVGPTHTKASPYSPCQCSANGSCYRPSGNALEI